jgi:endonuclease/exonuclease/phosphatase family metal-dependent hydrolase
MKNFTAKILLVIILSAACNAYSQDTIKIMTYNILNYNGANARDTNFRKIIKAVNPDVLVVGEMLSQTGMNDFLANCMNYWSPGLYSAGQFINGNDTDNGIFYKSSKFSFIFNSPITLSGSRDMNVFKLHHTQSQRDILLIAVHLKASEGSANEQQRLAEVNAIRGFTNSLPPGSDFMILGDFNIYGANEPAYGKLLEVQSGNEGHVYDYISLAGTWNNSSYRQYHTQSPRVRNFGGGSTGGMDDRFDMILYSKGVSEQGGIYYIPGTMTPYGNDGNHFNDSINKRPNTAVPDSIADALHYGADHIPVYAKFVFQQVSAINPISGILPDRFRLHQNYPNPFNPSTNIRFDIVKADFVELKIFDIMGREVSTLVKERLSPGAYRVPFNASGLSGGAYFYRITAGEFTETKKLLLVK